MAKNSKVSHDDAVAMIQSFSDKSSKLERRVTRKLKTINVDTQTKIVQWADDEVFAQFGHRIREIFES